MIGKAHPVIENPVPASVAELTVTAAVPEDVRFNDWVKMVFKFELPKARELVLTVNCDDTPVPLRLTVLVLPLVELLEIVIVPLAAPAAVGSKLTCSVAV